MAFTTTFVGKQSGLESNAYNIDFSVGAGVAGNLPDDILLVQTLFHIIHFELKDPIPPPSGETGIALDGKLGPRTLRFMLNLQQRARANNFKVMLDGVFDPMRGQGKLSTQAKVQYAMEILNHTAFGACRLEGNDKYDSLPTHPETPSLLAASLNAGRRQVAHKYEAVAAH
jgi:hypothetical protein